MLRSDFKELYLELFTHIPSQKQRIYIPNPYGRNTPFVNYLSSNRDVELFIGSNKDKYDDIQSKLLDIGIDWVITCPKSIINENEGNIESLMIFSGKTHEGVCLLTETLDIFKPQILKELYREKGVYLYKIVIFTHEGKERYFIIFKNRCCPGCHDKNNSCCPEEFKENEFEEESNYKHFERFDFFSYLEGNFTANIDMI